MVQPQESSAQAVGPHGLKAPFPYWGGKSSVAADVWARFGDATNYVEPFGGSAAVLLARPAWHHPHATETYNDADHFVANFWRATQAAPEEAARQCDWPLNETDLHARHLWLVNEGAQRLRDLGIETDPDAHDARVAGWWAWGLSAWLGSGWCVAGGRFGRDIKPLSVRWQRPHLGNCGQGVHRVELGDSQRDREERLAAWFRALRDRLRRVRICCGDWTRVLQPSATTAHGLTAVFLDPPYTQAERHGALYRTETDCAAEVRRWALDHGDDPRFRIALCGYDTEHGDAMPEHWTALRWEATGGYGYGRSGTGRGVDNKTRETIWFSPSCLTPHGRQLSFMEG